MKKGYYWIPQTDMTLNGMQFNRASVIGDIIFDQRRNVIQFQLNRYFPVGTIFHFTKNTVRYIITCRLKKAGLFYEAVREDKGCLDDGDIERFTSGRLACKASHSF